jgi:hypothetical protein
VGRPDRVFVSFGGHNVHYFFPAVCGGFFTSVADQDGGLHVEKKMKRLQQKK